MKSAVAIVILFVAGAFLFKTHRLIDSYNNDYRIAKYAYLDVYERAMANKTVGTDRFYGQLQESPGNLTPLAVLNYFDKNGSVIANMQSAGNAAWVWRTPPQAAKPVGIKLVGNNGVWLIDSICNLDILVLKMEHVR